MKALAARKTDRQKIKKLSEMRKTELRNLHFVTRAFQARCLLRVAYNSSVYGNCYILNDKSGRKSAIYQLKTQGGLTFYNSNSGHAYMAAVFRDRPSKPQVLSKKGLPQVYVSSLIDIDRFKYEIHEKHLEIKFRELLYSSSTVVRH